VTVVAVLLSGFMLGSGHVFFHANDVLDVTLRRALVYTLGFYVLLGLALFVFIQAKRVRLVWHRGGVAAAILLGAPLGAVGGLLGVAVNSGVSGHLASDPNVTMLVGGGGALRIMAALVTTAMLAPLVEETIFRGICAGTLVKYGATAAVWSSAIAFAFWHHNPSALRYYAAMGLVFAAIWRKRGLIASMSAHAAFNGVLTIAAVLATSGVGATTTFQGLSVFVPGGWHIDTSHAASGLEVVAGPSGSSMVLISRPQEGSGQTLDQLKARLQSSPVQTGISIAPSSVHEISGAVGAMLSADFTADSQPGHVLAFTYNGTIYEVVMVTAGNPAAEHEWKSVVQSVRPA
jgi:membrane protease YdiL (CAAX protease family)